jgi:hypothetical protein
VSHKTEWRVWSGCEAPSSPPPPRCILQASCSAPSVSVWSALARALQLSLRNNFRSRSGSHEDVSAWLVFALSGQLWPHKRLGRRNGVTTAVEEGSIGARGNWEGVTRPHALHRAALGVREALHVRPTRA